MNGSYIDLCGRKFAIGLRTEDRYQQFLMIAKDCGYSVYLQQFCLHYFDHSNLCVLTPPQMEQLMTYAEPIVFECAHQLRTK